MRRRAKLSTRILISQVVILFITMCIGFGLFVRVTSDQLDRQYQQRALSIAQSVAGMPQVRQALLPTTSARTATCRRWPTSVQRTTGADFVVVINTDRLRLTHPLPDLIGQPIERTGVRHGRPELHRPSTPACSGRRRTARRRCSRPDGTRDRRGVRRHPGTPGLRRAVAGTAVIAPVHGAGAGFRRDRGAGAGAAAQAHHVRPGTARDRAAAAGTRGHAARRPRGRDHLRPEGHVTLINDEAARLTRAAHGRDRQAAGRAAARRPAARRCCPAQLAGPDQLVLTDDYRLVVNRMAVRLAGRALGAVVTLRDRTEMDELLRN